MEKTIYCAIKSYYLYIYYEWNQIFRTQYNATKNTHNTNIYEIHIIEKLVTKISVDGKLEREGCTESALDRAP